MTNAFDAQQSIVDTVREAIEAHVPDSQASVSGAGGHFSISVTSPVFDGKSRLECQRLVYEAITHLMTGETAPVHAIDRLETEVPQRTG
ncbi:BolA/IbaG family iron-sulfur metabolism protein [Methylohalobius crimeensis]|uniref:BolA/IbaG family iron-sulfur metabolism protein n=1 Tax=Methylohalobius crimeensis TaxID=244365 RepID=UPI0003B4D388|nr:BolA/IbaG family iron-sulfur metabolism protein [Methylohalobius crimeensis]